MTTGTVVRRSSAREHVPRANEPGCRACAGGRRRSRPRGTRRASSAGAGSVGARAKRTVMVAPVPGRGDGDVDDGAGVHAARRVGVDDEQLDAAPLRVVGRPAQRRVRRRRHRRRRRPPADASARCHAGGHDHDRRGAVPADEAGGRARPQVAGPTPSAPAPTTTRSARRPASLRHVTRLAARRCRR